MFTYWLSGWTSMSEWILINWLRGQTSESEGMLTNQIK